MLSGKRPKIKQIKYGIHRNVMFFGTVIYQDTDPKIAIVTSDKKVYVDWGKRKNEIRDDFGLFYRYPFEYEVLDNHWSIKGIKKFLYEHKKPIKIGEIYKEVLDNNKGFMYYVDETSHEVVALDIVASLLGNHDVGGADI